MLYSYDVDPQATKRENNKQEFRPNNLSKVMRELLFSYGTLQLKKVQLETFGRKLNGVKAILPKYILSTLTITDEKVLTTSNESVHPIAQFTGKEEDYIEGVIFELSPSELELADSYEVAEYKRIKEIFKDGKSAWVYVCKKTNTTYPKL